MNKKEALAKIEELKKFIENEEKNDIKIIDDCFVIKRKGGVTMKDLYDKSPEYFYNIDWYKNEDFFTKEKTKEGWAVISKELLPETLNKTYAEQDSLIENRRTAVEIIYDLIVYKEKTGNNLLGKNYEWSSSRASDGKLVSVGHFDADGARVYRSTPDDSLAFSALLFPAVFENLRF